MGCRCRKKLNNPKSRNTDGLLTIQYTGTLLGSRNYKTPTGSIYRFGSGANATKLVNLRDRDYFSNLPDFMVLEG